jgi:hypothetical protein
MLDEIGELIRSFDPARTQIDAQIDARALIDLEHIVADRSARGRILKRARRHARWFLTPAIAVAVVALVVLQVLPTNQTPANSAMAATPPLLKSSPTHESVTDAIDKAIAQLRTYSQTITEPQRQARFESWYLNTDFDAHNVPTSYVSPQETILAWGPDLSGSLTVTAGKSTRSIDRRPLGPTPPLPGTVLQSDLFKSGEMGIVNQQLPPPGSPEILSYLQAATGKGSEATTSDLLDAITTLLNEWTLSADRQIAVLQVLKSVGHFAEIESVTDRLGRHGTAFVTIDEGHNFQRIVVISTSTGTILSTEKIYLGGLKDLKIDTPSVVTYTAWK